MPPLHIESVDPNLQAVAPTALHWRHVDEHTIELHQPAHAPALDGMGKPTTRLVGLVKYDAPSDMFFGYVHHQLGLQPGEPTLHITSRYLPQMAQEDLLGWLTDTKRL